MFVKDRFCYGVGWPRNHDSSLEALRVVVEPLSTTLAVTVTTSCRSRHTPTTTRVPTSVQRQRRPPHQNYNPDPKVFVLHHDRNLSRAADSILANMHLDLES